jgi:predicted DNA-binding transcriptional regulator AlpA
VVVMAMRTTTVNLDANSLVDKRTLAELMGISVRSIERLILHEELPAPFHQGKKAYWLGSTLLKHFQKLQAAALSV